MRAKTLTRRYRVVMVRRGCRDRDTTRQTTVQGRGFEDARLTAERENQGWRVMILSPLPRRTP